MFGTRDEKVLLTKFKKLYECGCDEELRELQDSAEIY
jgi:hypothetical protein